MIDFGSSDEKKANCHFFIHLIQKTRLVDSINFFFATVLKIFYQVTGGNFQRDERLRS